LHPHFESTLHDMLGPSIASAHKALKPGQHRICVIAGSGHGDNARGFAGCQALRAAEPQADIFVVMHFTGEMVELDMLHTAQITGVVNSGIPLQAVPEQALIHFLIPRFDVVYDMRPYAVVTYYNCDPTRKDCRLQLKRQAVADQRLKPFWFMASGHPLEWWRLKFCPMSQWDIMSHTLGIPVSELDLMAPMELAPYPKRAPERLKRDKTDVAAAVQGLQKGRYVVVQNGAAPESFTKRAPPFVFEEIVRALDLMNIRAVQVGYPTEDVIPGAVNRLGYRLPITNELLAHAICLVAVEGFMPYMAAALGKPSVVLFGPTLAQVFGMCQDRRVWPVPNLNLVRSVKDAEGGERVACPAGTCFWGGGRPHPAFRQEKWAVQCPWSGVSIGGKPLSADLPYCMNMVSPETAAAAVTEYVAAILKPPVEQEAVA